MSREDVERLVLELGAADHASAKRILAERVHELGPYFFDVLWARLAFEDADRIVRAYVATGGERQAALFDMASSILRLLGTEMGERRLLAARESGLASELLDFVIHLAERAIDIENDEDLARRATMLMRRLHAMGAPEEFEAQVHLVNGNFELAYGELAAAEAEFRKGFASVAADPGTLVAGALLVSQGSLLLRQRRFAEAADFYEGQASAIVDFRQRAAARMNLAWAYSCTGRLGSALSVLQELEAGCRASGNANLLADVLGNLAVAADRLGLPEARESYLFDAHDLRIKPADARHELDWVAIAESCTNIAMLYASKAQYDTARHWMAQRATALAGAPKTGDNHAIEKRILISFALGEGDPEEAWRIAEDLASPLLGREDGALSDEEILLLANSGRAAFASGRIAEAARIFSRITELCQSSGTEDLLASSCGYLALTMIAQGRLDAGRREIDRMVEAERGIRRGLRDPLHQFTFSAVNEELFEKLLETLSALGEARRLFEVVQVTKAFAISINVGPPVTFEQFAASLPERVAFLEYVHCGKLDLCILITANAGDPVVVDLDLGPNALEDWANAFERVVPLARLAPDDQPFEILRAASDNLIAPVLDALGQDVDDLVIAPVGAATRLPFHVFRLASGDRLIDRFAVSYAPNSTSWHAGQSRSRRPSSGTVIVHPQRADSPAVRAMFLRETADVARILGRAGVSSAEPIVDGRNTRRALLERLSLDVLHVAAHGTFATQNPKETGLILSSDGDDALVSLDVFAGNQAASELVFFSGCDTGRVDALRNQEMLGLMSVLLSQRVNAAVLSFWPIPAVSDTVLEVIRTFYERWLLRGESKAHALRGAMRSRSDARIYEWGGFAIFGFGAEAWPGRGVANHTDSAPEG